MQTKLITPQELFMLPVQFEVPEFQRRYVWNKEQQWEPLWEDVTDIAESVLQNSASEEKHFLGAVVLQPKAQTGNMGRGIVIDGQQRLITLQLMMDAVQEVITRNNFKDESERLRMLIENADAFIGDSPDWKFKVWPTVFDQTAFRCAMHDELNSLNHTNSLVVQAHQYFKTQTQNWLDTQSVHETAREKITNALGQTIRRSLQLVVIDLGEEDPHLIFETMNARGTPLLQSDMVKNSIIHEAKEYAKTSGKQEPKKTELWSFDEHNHDYWAQEIGRGFNRRPRIDVFLSHWLTFRNRRITRQYREFETFRKYSKKLDSTQTICDVAEDLSNIGDLYRDIDDCAVEGIQAFLLRCKVMNLGAVTPLLFWFLTNEHLKQQPDVLTNCIRILDSFFVRRAVCGYHARSYASIGGQLLRYLADVSEPTDHALNDYLSKQTALGELWPSDEQLKVRFVEDPLYQWIAQGRLRLVLVAIEERLRPKFVEETSVSNAENLQIEHVMPVSWNNHWPLPENLIDSLETMKEERDRVIHTIGNLTLVTQPLNPVLSNKAWDEKKKAIDEHSLLFLNKQLVKNDRWDESTIRTRSVWLFEHARKIWPHADQILDSRS